MILGISLYLIFGIAITCSSRTNVMWNEGWFKNLLHIVAYPVIIYITMVKTARLAVRLVEMMDEQKNDQPGEYNANRWMEGMSSMEFPKEFLYENAKKYDGDPPKIVESTNNGIITIDVNEASYIIRPNDVKLVARALRSFMTQHSLMTGRTVSDEDMATAARLAQDMDAPQLQCRAVDQDMHRPEPECGQDMLESVEFYNLMQNYRIAPIFRQSNVVDRYEAVKTYIRKYFSPWK